MRLDPNERSRLLAMGLELAIGFCYLFLGQEHPTYLIIGVAHFVSVLIHGGGHSGGRE